MKNSIKKREYKHKQWFTATIQDVECIGRVSINDGGRIFLVYENKMNGLSANDRLGFTYSWTIESGDYRDLAYNDVRDLKLFSRKPRVSYKK